MACFPNTTVTTDNTPLTCDDYISTECIIHEAAIAYLSLPTNSTMTQVVAALLASLMNARERIVDLEEIVGDFETRITTLETP